jgi:hypothetical protein
MDILPETHPVFKPEMIPMDFSAFSNFNVARHSYWEKTVEEINTYLQTGSFPERGNTQQANNVANVANAYAATQAPAYTAPTAGGYAPQAPTAYAAPQTTPVPPVTQSTPTPQAPVAQPTASPTPTRNFTGFSF